MTAVIAGPNNGMRFTTSIRVQGNQIGRQRQILFDYWADKTKDRLDTMGRFRHSIKPRGYAETLADSR
jgi:hypothetical protein